MINKKDTVIQLIKELKQASQAYYQDLEISELSDEEFDEKLEFLKDVSNDPSLEELFKDGSDGFNLIEGGPALGSQVNSDETITHSNKMLSLKKAKTESEVKSYLKKTRLAGAKDFVLQAKLDGFALSALYINEDLKILATRGDGEVGENVSYLISADKVKIKGLPLTIPMNTGRLEIRGEIFLTDEQFKKIDDSRLNATGERFRNPRNAIVGIMKKAKLGVDYEVEATFSTYGAFRDDTPIDLEKVSNYGLLTVNEITKKQAPKVKLSGFLNDEEVFSEIEKFGIARESFTIPTDGVVVKPSNDAKLLVSMGATSSHPVSQIAYKYPGETAITQVKAIDITVGKTGKLTPIGRFDPVLLDGSMISNASLHNFNWLDEKDVGIGSIVSLKKAGDIIPQVSHVISNPSNVQKIKTPETCPVCHENVVNKGPENPPKTLVCVNITCPSRELFILNTAVKKEYFNIDGLAESVVNYLYASKRITKISDFYTLTVNELKEMPNGKRKDGGLIKVGEKRAMNIINHLELSKTRPLSKMLAGIGIETLGSRASKDLSKNFKTIEAIRKASVKDISSIDGFGDIKAETIVKGLEIYSQEIDALLSHGVQFTPEYDDNESALNTKVFNGESFSITGSVPDGFSNRNALIDFIETNGGAFHSSPKSSTNYLIGDKTSNSSKIKKAISLGISVISPEEFVTTYLNK